MKKDNTSSSNIPFKYAFICKISLVIARILLPFHLTLLQNHELQFFSLFFFRSELAFLHVTACPSKIPARFLQAACNDVSAESLRTTIRDRHASCSSRSWPGGKQAGEKESLCHPDSEDPNQLQARL